MNKRFLHILAAFPVVVALSGCGPSDEEKAEQARINRKEAARQEAAALKIATTPTLDCLPLFIGVTDSTFQRAGVDVRLKTRNAQLDGDTLITGGHVEGFVTDLVRAERLKLKGTALTYVAATNAYWQIISNHTARIKELKQLGDKMIAITRFSATEYLADVAIDSAKPKNDVYRVQINDVNLRLQMLLCNNMDAIVVPEPQATTARLASNPVLIDSRKKGFAPGVIAFRDKGIAGKERQEQLKAFVKTYNALCDSINKNGLSHYAEVIKQYTGADDKTIAKLPKLRYAHATAPREADVAKAKKRAESIGR